MFKVYTQKNILLTYVFFAHKVIIANAHCVIWLHNFRLIIITVQRNGERNACMTSLILSSLLFLTPAHSAIAPFAFHFCCYFLLYLFFLFLQQNVIMAVPFFSFLSCFEKTRKKRESQTKYVTHVKLCHLIYSA